MWLYLHSLPGGLAELHGSGAGQQRSKKSIVRAVIMEESQDWCNTCRQTAKVWHKIAVPDVPENSFLYCILQLNLIECRFNGLLGVRHVGELLWCLFLVFRGVTVANIIPKAQVWPCLWLPRVLHREQTSHVMQLLQPITHSWPTSCFCFCDTQIDWSSVSTAPLRFLCGRGID